MLCLKKRRTYSFTQGACTEAPRRRMRSASASKRGDHHEEQRYNEAIATLPRKHTPREERSSAMVLTVTEDTPADMLAGSMELLVQMPRDHHVQTQRVTVQRSTPMMDLLVQIATAHKLAASSYTLQAIGERGLVLPHQPNTPIGALDALQVKLLPKQGTFLSRKSRQTNQPFETTFRLQVHLPRNQLYVSRVSPKTNLGEILDEVCREKNLDRNKYELRHPANIAEILNLSHTLQDYHLQEVTLCARQQSRGMIGSALSSQDIMALQKQEECRRQQNARQSVFGFMFKKSKESSLSTDSLGNRSVSPARSDETARSSSPIQQQPQRQEQKQEPPPPPARPLRKRRPAPKPPTQQPNSQTKTTAVSRTESKSASDSGGSTTTSVVADKDKIVISHSRNSSDSSGYHEASVLSDNPDNATSSRMPETLPRRGRMQGILEAPRKLAHTSQASKSLGNLAMASSHGGGTLTRGISNTSLSSAGQRKKRVAPPPPMARPLPSAISTQGLERIVDSDESLTSDMDLSKPSSDIDMGVGATGSSKASSDIGCHRHVPVRPPISEEPLADAKDPVEPARVVKRDTPTPPVPRPRKMLRAPASPSPSLSSTSTLDASSPSSQFEFCRVVACSSPVASSVVDAASFGLPSLTEDEREEIALAIDSIVEAAKAHGDDDSMSPRSESGLGIRRASEAFAQHDILRAMERDEEVKRKDSVNSTETIKSDIVAVSDVDIHVSDVPKEDRHDSLPETVTPPATPPPNDEDSTKHSAAAPFCAVISTIPKCDHLESYTDNDFGKEDSSTPTLAPKRRGKVARSQSEMGHFEVGTPEKHGNRHLTSNVGAAIAYALNPNLGEAATRRIEAAMSLGEGKAPPTDTDILLQKVSDALSSRGPTTPPSPPPTPEDSLAAPDFAAATQTGGRQSVTAEPPKGFENELNSATVGEENSAPVELNGKESTSAAVVSDGNATLGSQQDTSDYVSASGEDLSIGDWEYQIPAPPSAFRDDNDPVEEVAVKKQEGAVKEQAAVEPIEAPISIESEIHRPVPPTAEPEKQSTPEPKPSKPLIERTISESEPQPRTVDSVDFCAPKPPKPITPQLSHEEAELKKAEVISELETKINSNRPIVEPAVVKDDSYAPKIAPVENNLSNFTITTYSRQKSLDIFEHMDHEQQHSENRVLNTFATLQRGRSMAADYAEERMKSGFLKNAQSMERVAMTLVDDRAQFGDRNDILREKSTVHRSKSYIVLSSNEKFQNRANEIEKSRDEKYDERFDYDTNDLSRKYTSLANVNSSTNDDMPRHKEKFSQWRDNILRNQKEPTEEKQLQSLQVLKSILPKLKNAQVTESNGYKSVNDNFTTKKQQEPLPDRARASSPVTTTTTTTEMQYRANRRQEPQAPAKRYTYCGPPAVSLGSWSERPFVNVQIKTDTDYKFGGSNNNGSSNSASGARTIVSLNGSGGGGGNEVSERMTNGSALTSERKEPTIVNSKSAVDGGKKEEKDESRVDTSSVNFRELTKAFGQAEVRLRSKPLAARPIQNRHSEYIDRSEPDSLTPKQNGFADNGHQHHLSTTTFGHMRTNGPPPSVRRYTSVVGINNNNNNNDVNENNNKVSSQLQTHFRFTNGHGSVGPKPPVTPPKTKEYTVPKPPTMPIITGVTLKSVNARPKSSPPTTQADPRDQLLESIRNFGGREKLRNSAERY